MKIGAQELVVIEEDHQVDAVTLEKLDEGVTYLFIRPGQSFDSAVKSVLRVCPELSLRHVQDLIRTQCPSIIEMNERLGANQTIPRFEAAPDAGVVPPAPVRTAAHRRPRPPRWARVAAVAAPALVGGALLAQLLNPGARSADSGASPTASSSTSRDEQIAAGTYHSPDFKKIAEGGRMKCDPIGPYEAHCVDSDGKVMTSEASVGTSTAFTFSYDYEKIGFRVFPDEESATAWAAEEGNRDLYQNVRQHGRVVLWGTDAARIGEWEKSILADERQHGRHARTTSYEHGQPLVSAEEEQAAAGLPDNAPLPDRLAVLAFGTLGVTEETIQQAVQSNDVQSFQLLHAVQLVLGSADSSALDTVPAGPGDAVAIVADATTGPVDETQVDPHGGTGEAVEPTGPVVLADPAPPTPTSTATASPVSTVTPTPAAPPSQDSAPTSAPPVISAPADQAPPTDTKSADTDPAPADPPKADVPPPPPADPTPPQEPVVLPPPQAPDLPAQPDPAADPTAQPGPGPVAEVPAADQQDQDAQTPPAPPAEEPDGDGLALDGLPAAWAA